MLPLQCGSCHERLAPKLQILLLYPLRLQTTAFPLRPSYRIVKSIIWYSNLSRIFNHSYRLTERRQLSTTTSLRIKHICTQKIIHHGVRLFARHELNASAHEPTIIDPLLTTVFSKEKTHINVVVIGHVDSGKSTTTGRKRCTSSRVYDERDTHK